MGFHTDVYLGSLIGVIVAFKALLFGLPDKKLAFAFNAVLLHYMVGGLHRTSWEKFFVALITYHVVEHFEALLNLAWDTAQPFLMQNPLLAPFVGDGGGAEASAAPAADGSSGEAAGSAVTKTNVTVMETQEVAPARVGLCRALCDALCPTIVM